MKGIKLKNQVNYYNMVLGEKYYVFDNVIPTDLQQELLNYFDNNYKT